MKLLTLNLNYDEPTHGAWKLRRDLIVHAIRQQGPDVAVFQAVRADPRTENGVDQAVQIARGLPGYHQVRFETAVRYPNGRCDGSAIVSRLPLRDVDVLHLSRPPERRGEPVGDPLPRVMLSAGIAGRRLTVFNGHFSWVYPQTVSNMEEALAYMGRVEGPRVLMGDLNTAPDAPVMERLRQTGWHDAWALLRSGEPGWTFDAHGLEKRIDYVWVTADVVPRLQTMEVVQAAPNAQNAELSDHFGLCVTLRNSDE